MVTTAPPPRWAFNPVAYHGWWIDVSYFDHPTWGKQWIARIGTDHAVTRLPEGSGMHGYASEAAALRQAKQWARDHRPGLRRQRRTSSRAARRRGER